jgi:hypothetical protein
MKAKSIQAAYWLLWRILLIVLPLLAAKAVVAQNFNFRNPTRISGTNLQVGAVYRFANVKGGTDALVRINAMTNGATLDELDRTDDGYGQAFQPAISVPANRNGYVEFIITFVNSGATTPPQTQPDFAVSAVDVDGSTSGSRRLYEYVAFNVGGGFVDFDGITGQVTVSNNGNLFTARNSTGTDFSGMDTANRQFMFSAVNNNVSSFTVRVGIENNFTSEQTRNMSVYFKRFAFPNSVVLPLAPIVDFKGAEKENGIHLQWNYTTTRYVKSVSLERSTDALNYTHEKEFLVDPAAGQETVQYVDAGARVSNRVYYRLRTNMITGQEIYSAILSFPLQGSVNNFNLYPTVFTSTITLSFKAEKEADAVFELATYTGKVVYSRRQRLQKGINSFSAGSFGHLHAGMCIATLKTPEQVCSQQVIKGW